MAVSKINRRSSSDTRRLAQQFFRESHIPQERRQAWLDATAHLEARTATLRFPVYEDLFNLNFHAQKLFDLVGEIHEKLHRPSDESVYRQCLVQQIRSGVTSDVLDQMNDIECTEAWLFESLGRHEQMKLRDPEDVYLMVREQEAERAQNGLPPRLQFLEDSTDHEVQSPAKKSVRPRKPGKKTLRKRARRG
jgi:hypothetical protein